MDIFVFYNTGYVLRDRGRLKPVSRLHSSGSVAGGGGMALGVPPGVGSLAGYHAP